MSADVLAAEAAARRAEEQAERLRTIAASLLRHADEIESKFRSVGAYDHDWAWQGRKADDFRAGWDEAENTVERGSAAVVPALREAAARLEWVSATMQPLPGASWVSSLPGQSPYLSLFGVTAG